ncbi:MAG TPA: hypothetical protein VL854_11885 [Nitrososphaeraceae archaeon]|nr:hypothetical protein [Nitrososphaeraceae archaeon]
MKWKIYKLKPKDKKEIDKLMVNNRPGPYTEAAAYIKTLTYLPQYFTCKKCNEINSLVPHVLHMEKAHNITNWYHTLSMHLTDYITE